MAAKLGVLFIHGMGSILPNFADAMIEKIKANISDHGLDPASILCKTAYWAPVLSDRQKILWDRLSTKYRLDWEPLRKFVISAFGDATAYRWEPTRTNTTYGKIHEVVFDATKYMRIELDNADKPIVVIAHSLGSVIISDYIWDRQKRKQDLVPDRTNEFERMDTLVGIMTFGSPIPLFILAYDPVLSIKFPPPALPQNLITVAKWLNFYDRDDVFGWPLKRLSNSYRNAVTKDIEINVGSILNSWNPLSHKEYWGDDDLAGRVADYLSEILRKCP